MKTIILDLAMFCFAMAVMLLAFPNSDVAQWASRLACHPFRLYQSVSNYWQLFAGGMFALAGIALASLRWYIS
jgi:hypothetical protein